MSTQKIQIPDLGGAEEAEVIEICVAVGEKITLDQSLLVLESDKASMEVPSPLEGTVSAILVSDGDAVQAGDAILEVDTQAGSAASEQAEEAPSAPPAAEAPAAPAAPTKAKAPASQQQAVNLPDIGADAAEVIELSIKPGDSLAEGDTIAVLESDKASMEVPSPAAGTVLAIHIKEGDELNTGDLLIDLETADTAQPAAAEAAKAPPETPKAESAPPAPPTPQQQEQAPVAKPAAQPASAAQDVAASSSTASASVYAGPAVRKLAREFGVDLALLSGSGPRQRILKEDIQQYVKSRLQSSSGSSGTAGDGIQPIPEVDFSVFGEIRLEDMSRLHKLTAANMRRSWLNVPHVTQYDDADITDLEEFRASMKKQMEQRGVKLSPLPFLFKACAVALMRHPKFRSSLHADGQQIVYKEYCHIGMAVDTPAGLVVPVLRDVDQKSVWQIGEEILDLAARAKDRKLRAEEMQGGCFTISSLGNIGGLGFTPIVNAPEVGILGVSRMTVKPVFDGDAFVPRKMLPLSLSYDHRAINGGDAGRFLTELCALLSDLRLQLM